MPEQSGSFLGAHRFAWAGCAWFGGLQWRPRFTQRHPCLHGVLTQVENSEPAFVPGHTSKGALPASLGSTVLQGPVRPSRRGLQVLVLGAHPRHRPGHKQIPFIAHGRDAASIRASGGPSPWVHGERQHPLQGGKPSAAPSVSCKRVLEAPGRSVERVHRGLCWGEACCTHPCSLGCLTRIGGSPRCGGGDAHRGESEHTGP